MKLSNDKIINLKGIKTPNYVIHKDLLEKNLLLLDYIQKESSVKFLLALKSYSFIPSFSLMNNYLIGICASGLHEAKLGRDFFCKDNQIVETYSPAYKEEEIEEITQVSDMVIFNSLKQLKKYQNIVLKNKKRIGIRINPLTNKYAPNELFNPVSETSRFGIRIDNKSDILEIEKLIKEKIITYIHSHVLCESDFIGLEEQVTTLSKKIPQLLKNVQTVNIGGGVLYTHKNFEINKCIKLFNDFTKKYNIELIAEPGESCTYNSGTMVSRIEEILHIKELSIAIIDLSTQCHNIDVMQLSDYYVKIEGARLEKSKRYKYKYLISSITCLSGDNWGYYYFEKELIEGDKIIMLDTSYYTKVQWTQFNGIKLPISTYMSKEGNILYEKEKGYKEFIEYSK